MKGPPPELFSFKSYEGKHVSTDSLWCPLTASHLALWYIANGHGMLSGGLLCLTGLRMSIGGPLRASHVPLRHPKGPNGMLSGDTIGSQL